MSQEKTVFTPPPLSGYRKLDQFEVSLINEVKAAQAEYLRVLGRVKEHLTQQRKACHRLPTAEARAEEQLRLDDAEPERWVAMARSDIQTATMKLVRAVAQPSE